jgi:hypothetical protein
MAWKPFGGRRLLLCLALLALAGCQEQEQVREISVPKEPPLRVLAVMVPRDDSTWFFKLLGPAPEVAKHVRAFDDFVASVRFNKRANPPLEWTVPQDWDEEHSDDRFYAVVRFAGEGMPLPITVSRLGARAGSLRANIDRWRVQQLGLEPIGDAELKKLEGKIEVGGTKATRVDFVGPGPGKGLLRRASPRPPIAEVRPTFTKPEGWKELPSGAPHGGVRAAAFRIESGEQTAQVTVIRLAGEGGGALANVNLWRKDVGLDPVTEDQFRKDLRSLDTAAGRASYVDLTGRDGADARGILAAWLPHDGQTWFLTMKGPADLVGRQRSAFEAFVKSFRLEGGLGVAHE